MTTRILIGIGGTGAKVVEAATHLAAAGLAGEALIIGLVDQDRANGNARRTLGVIEAYRDARAGWTVEGDDNKLEMAGDAALTPFRTAIELLDDDPFVPQQQPNSKLGELLQVQPGEQALFDLLFDDDEQTLVLDEGYRGRPHIGAAAITHALENETHPFWDALEAKIRAARSGQVDLMLAGSVFGGTGAAGFPTIARLIRDRVRQLGIAANIRIGGALMLPYFSFGEPAADDNVARSDDLLPQTRDALNHYVHLLAEDPLFDALYLTGWDPPLPLGYFAPGNDAQRNPAMLPEFIAAHGISHFFAPQANDAPGQKIYVSAREGAALTWTDLDPIAGVDVQGRFGQLLRFALAWKHYRPTLEVPVGAITRWLSGSGPLSAQKPPRHAPKALFNLTSRYLDLLVAWAAEVERNGGGAQLWTLQSLVVPEAERSASAPPKIAPTIDAAFVGAYDSAAGANSHSAAKLQERLASKRAQGAHHGHGVALAALYQFAGVKEAADNVQA